jgi:hypothetical protein
MLSTHGLPQARLVAITTTLMSLVVGVDAVGSDDAGYHRTGLALLVIVGVAVVGAWQSRGEPHPMLRWLTVLALLQVALLVMLLAGPVTTPRVAITVMVVPLAGWVLAATLLIARG